MSLLIVYLALKEITKKKRNRKSKALKESNKPQDNEKPSKMESPAKMTMKDIFGEDDDIFTTNVVENDDKPIPNFNNSNNLDNIKEVSNPLH